MEARMARTAMLVRVLQQRSINKVFPNFHSLAHLHRHQYEYNINKHHLVLGPSIAPSVSYQLVAPFATRIPPPADHHEGSNRERRFLGRLVMSEEARERRVNKIQAQKEEEVPQKFFAKFHYYFKRYWYIAIPVHTVVCGLWFVGLYLAVKSGMNVVAFLQWLHVPDKWVQKVRDAPPSAGITVAALILYKIVMPLRYACSLVGIRYTYNVLRSWGWLRTTREVELAARQRSDGMLKSMARRRQQRKQFATMKKQRSPREGGSSKVKSDD